MLMGEQGDMGKQRGRGVQRGIWPHLPDNIPLMPPCMRGTHLRG